MKNCFRNNRIGYTIVELMVIVLIVAILAATLGTFFVKLLTLQENEREEAYVCEKLSDFCSDYANMISEGSWFGTNKDFQVRVKFRQESGGISLETGRVAQAVYLTTTTNTSIRALDLNVDRYDVESENGLYSAFSRIVDADPTLIKIREGRMLRLICTLMPLRTESSNPQEINMDDQNLKCFCVTDATCGYLKVQAIYRYKNDKWKETQRTATVERIVRLWNKE